MSADEPVGLKPLSPEPWLRGLNTGANPVIAPVLLAFQQAREDLEFHTRGLTETQLWFRPLGLPSVGFHLAHIAGSVDRLTTYLESRALSETQLDALRDEPEMTAGKPGAARENLLTAMDTAMRQSEAAMRDFDGARFGDPREVGRKRLPTTAIGLMIHLAEHTQRHAGAAITMCRLVKALEQVQAQKQLRDTAG